MGGPHPRTQEKLSLATLNERMPQRNQLVRLEGVAERGSYRIAMQGAGARDSTSLGFLELLELTEIEASTLGLSFLEEEADSKAEEGAEGAEGAERR